MSFRNISVKNNFSALERRAKKRTKQNEELKNSKSFFATFCSAYATNLLNLHVTDHPKPLATLSYYEYFYISHLNSSSLLLRVIFLTQLLVRLQKDSNSLEGLTEVETFHWVQCNFDPGLLADMLFQGDIIWDITFCSI